MTFGCEQGDGLPGLAQALAIGGEAVVARLEASGLRELGGGGRPVGPKWRICLETDADEKFAVCNAVDAAPGAAVCRFLLGRDPLAVLEGLLIAAYAVGARRCFVCVNAGCVAEAALLRQAIGEMEQREWQSIAGPEWSCDIEIVEVPSSLVAGEDGALLAAVEGRQALPDLRFQEPAVRGAHGRPTLIESAETLANVSAIFRTGAPTGTKLVTIRGDVSSERTVEVRLGTRIREVIEALEGQALADLQIRAVQLGGPAGIFVGPELLDLALDYPELESAGACFGAGTLTVFRGARCPVEIAGDTWAYLQRESCGKCSACGEGTRQIAGLLTEIAQNHGTSAELDLARELGAFMRDHSLCAVGTNAGEAVLKFLEVFAPDLRSHLEDRRCSVRDCPSAGDSTG